MLGVGPFFTTYKSMIIGVRMSINAVPIIGRKLLAQIYPLVIFNENLGISGT